eukprot:976211-Rhodomonas_salina.2
MALPDTVRSWDLASRQMGFEFAAEDGPVTALKVWPQTNLLSGEEHVRCGTECMRGGWVGWSGGKMRGA